MAVLIRVDPVLLRNHAGEIERLAADLRGVEQGVTSAASSAPSYDGQFGPQVNSMGLEVAAQARSLADRLQVLSDRLRLKADEFEQADLAGADGLAAIGTPTNIPGDLAELMGEIPWWIWLILGIVPLGDSLGLLEELLNFLGGRGISQLNLWLSLAGLAADAGWLDLLIPDPVDGINIGLAGIKAAVRTLGRLPPAAEKAILEALQAAVKNPDELARIGKVLATLAGNSDIARKVIADEDALRALLRMKNGPELLEAIAKGGDDLIAQIPPNAAVRTSNLAQTYGFDIHIAGRWSDTAAEITKRGDAFNEAQLRAYQRSATEGISFDDAMREEVIKVSDEFGMNPHQVKISTGGAEVDAFIPYDQWHNYLVDAADDALREYAEKNGLQAVTDIPLEEARRIIVDATSKAKGAFTDDMWKAFYGGSPNPRVDLYQTLDPVTGWPDPKVNIPKGAVSFSSDGNLSHVPLGNP